MSKSTKKMATPGGINKTGAMTSPIDSAKLAEGPQWRGPLVPGSSLDVGMARVAYAKAAEPIGTVPPPGTLKGVAKTAVKLVQGKNENVFIDKLGERAAFERTGARLYEAALTKLDAYGSWDGGPSRESLLEILRDELAHFDLVRQAIEEVGADPTAMTPAADVAAVASQGLKAVITDPRMDLRQTMEAICIAELTDNDAWERLIELARGMGQADMAERFQRALDAEERHLLLVRGWLHAADSQTAGTQPSTVTPHATGGPDIPGAV